MVGTLDGDPSADEEEPGEQVEQWGAEEEQSSKDESWTRESWVEKAAGDQWTDKKDYKKELRRGGEKPTSEINSKTTQGQAK